MKVVVICRHGIASYIGGTTDPSLSAMGKKQVRALADKLLQMFPGGVAPLICTSSTRRGEETGEILRGVLDGRVITRPALGPGGRSEDCVEKINRMRRREPFFIAVTHMEHFGSLALGLNSELPHADILHLEYGAHVFDLENRVYTRIEAD